MSTRSCSTANAAARTRSCSSGTTTQVNVRGKLGGHRHVRPRDVVTSLERSQRRLEQSFGRRSPSSSWTNGPMHSISA